VKTVTFLYLLLITTLTSAHAQQVLESVSLELKSQKNISYVDVVKTKFSFQVDYSVDTLQSQIAFSQKEEQTGGYYRLESSKNSFLFDGNKLIVLDKTDSTYRLEKTAITGQNTRSLLYWVKEINHYVNGYPSKLNQLPDTIINSVSCFHSRITSYDTVQNGLRCYTISDFFVNRDTRFPMIIRTQTKGLTDDGTLIGLEEVHNYSAYMTGDRFFPDLSVTNIPEHFRPPLKGKPLSFLENRTPAPEILLTDLEDRQHGIESLKGKIVLLNFTSVSCPHCVSAANMLNSLSDLYGSDRFSCHQYLPIRQERINRKILQEIQCNNFKHYSSKYRSKSFSS
jgi:thiol-disulfide isomerase/thioredoxin